MLFGENFSLTLLTDDPVVAERGDHAGINHIGVDFETLGKYARQPESGAWISHHTLQDLVAVGRARSSRQIEELLAHGVTSLPA